MAQQVTYDVTMNKQLRNKAMTDILEVLHETPKAQKFGKYKQDMLLRLAGNILPRLNAGRDDDEKLYPSPLCGGTAE